MTYSSVAPRYRPTPSSSTIIVLIVITIVLVVVSYSVSVAISSSCIHQIPIFVFIGSTSHARWGNGVGTQTPENPHPKTQSVIIHFTCDFKLHKIHRCDCISFMPHAACLMDGNVCLCRYVLVRK